MFTKFLPSLLLVMFAIPISASAAEPMPMIELRDAPLIGLSGGQDSTGRIHSIDSNSPAEWDSNGNLFVFTSSQQPFRSSGANMFSLSWPALPVYIAPRADVRGGQFLRLRLGAPGHRQRRHRH